MLRRLGRQQVHQDLLLRELHERYAATPSHLRSDGHEALPRQSDVQAESDAPRLLLLRLSRAIVSPNVDVEV